jgi:hypothetical protein
MPWRAFGPARWRPSDGISISKWTLDLGESPAVTLTTEVRNEQTTQCPRRLIS